MKTTQVPVQPEWTAASVIGLSGGYWASCAVQAAVMLDMFTVLGTTSYTVMRLAKTLQCNERALNMLVTALTALGFLTRSGESVTATPAAQRFLSKNSPEYVGFIIAHHASLMPFWAQLAETVRTGAPAKTISASHTENEAEREAFLMGMFNIASQQAGNIAAAIDLSGRKRLLDLGGGPGTYAVYFCKENPALTATVYDRPTTRKFAEEIITRYSMAGRIDFVGNDFTTDTIPGGYDVVWISQILHGESPPEAAALVAKAVQALNPGGSIYIQDFVLDDDLTGPAHPALFSLNMLVGTHGGQSYTDKEIRSMMRDAGLTDVQRLDIPLPSGCGIIMGTL